MDMIRDDIRKSILNYGEHGSPENNMPPANPDSVKKALKFLDYMYVHPEIKPTAELAANGNVIIKYEHEEDKLILDFNFMLNSRNFVLILHQCKEDGKLLHQNLSIFFARTPPLQCFVSQNISGGMNSL